MRALSGIRDISYSKAIPLYMFNLPTVYNEIDERHEILTSRGHDDDVPLSDSQTQRPYAVYSVQRAIARSSVP